ncbi:MAG TPA: hypothetical protein VGE52_19265, partial [Pirellulales bacterium]
MGRGASAAPALDAAESLAYGQSRNERATPPRRAIKQRGPGRPMKFEELIILLPCHSLEDFPLYHQGDEAEGLLAAWTALFHPAFLASAQTLPTWRRA